MSEGRGGLVAEMELQRIHNDVIGETRDCNVTGSIKRLHFKNPRRGILKLQLIGR